MHCNLIVVKCALDQGLTAKQANQIPWQAYPQDFWKIFASALKALH